MSHLHIDASIGAAGDMLLAALLAAGADLDRVQRSVDAVAPGAVRLSTRLVSRSGLAASLLDVQVLDAGAGAGHWADLEPRLAAADLPAGVRARALGAFAALARAEAAVHGIPASRVHFHEVGAVDSIADVVGVCAALADLGVATLSCTTVGIGSGQADTQHGRIPVPVPAVVELLKQAPTAAGPLMFEACTPTAAALLASGVDQWGPQPQMIVRRTGTGAGRRQQTGVPNVLRVFLGDAVPRSTESAGRGAAPVAEPSTARLLQTNVDDLDPRLWPHVVAALLAAGAADAWLTPILMKKGRPAHTLSVLVPADRAEAVRRVIFTETSAIGLRESTFDKSALDRQMEQVEVHGQTIAVKVARDGTGAVLNVQPEWEDVRRAAAALALPAKQVLALAAAQAAEHWPAPPADGAGPTHGGGH